MSKLNPLATAWCVAENMMLAVINEGLGYSLRILQIHMQGVPMPASNPQEGTYGHTRALLEQLKGSGAKLSIATKSDLILRDLDLIKSFPNARVSWSINTLDESFREDMDKAVSIERRLAAMKAFAAEVGLDYVTNDDSRDKDFNAPPVIVNYFLQNR